MTGIMVKWESQMCRCSAYSDGDGQLVLQPCDEEHEPLCAKVGAVEVEQKKREITKSVNRGLPRSFVHIIERYSRGDPTFHRPPQVTMNPIALDAEMAFFLIESHGVVITSCANPERLATLLAGKASQGLSEKMWLEDWAKDRLFLPEEYVVGGDLDLCAAEAMFRPLHPELLWACGWDENFSSETVVAD